MNFIVVIYPDGEVHKIPQDDPLYKSTLAQIHTTAHQFTPYSDDSSLGLFYDVVGSIGQVRFKILSTTTTTTSTIK